MKSTKNQFVNQNAKEVCSFLPGVPLSPHKGPQKPNHETAW